MKTRLLVPFFAALVITAPGTSNDQQRQEESLLAWWQTNGETPVDYVVSRFDASDWVFLGEYHRIRDDLRLVADLIPALHRRTRVRHLALESLCRTRTDAANKLINSPSYDRAEVIDFLREQDPSWAYEEYLELYRTAWESNRAFGDDRGVFRFVGLDPCIDWEVINYSENREDAERELNKRDRYDEIMASELVTKLLEPRHPALVFTGIAHSTARFVEYRQGSDEQLVRMGNMVRREPWADRMFFIALHAPFWDAGVREDIYPFDGILDRAMALRRAAVAFDVGASPVARLKHERQSERSITSYEFGELYDGYIMHATPLKETVGVTCVSDWMDSEDEYRHFWRNLPNREASERFSRVPFNEFRRDFCVPRPDYGLLFQRRFRKLPDLK